MSSTFRFDLAFAPGNSLCCDFYDPRRHLEEDDTKLPDDLTTLLKHWISERKPSQDDESAASKPPPVPSELSDATPWDDGSDLDHGKAAPGPDSLNHEPGATDAAANIAKKRTGTTSTATSTYPRIHSLAFGSRPHESAIIFKAGKEWFIGGRVFERLSMLTSWMVHSSSTFTSSTNRMSTSTSPKSTSTWISTIDPSRAPHLKVFFGPESTYFAVNETGEYRTNIDEDPEFRDWLEESQKIYDNAIEGSGKTDNNYRNGEVIQPDFMPHSLALGPDDMFCWISNSQFCSNKSFKATFPKIQRTLEQEQQRKRLGEIVCDQYLSTARILTAYFALATADGVCIASVPPAQSDKFARYASHIGAIARAKWTMKMNDLQASYDELVGMADQAEQVIVVPKTQETQQAVGSDGQAKQSSTESTAVQNMRRIIQALSAIKGHCDLTVTLSEEEQNAKSNDLDDRVGILLRASKHRASDLVELTKAEDIFIAAILKLIAAAYPVDKTTSKAEAEANTREKNEQPVVENAGANNPEQSTVENPEEKKKEQSGTEEKAGDDQQTPAPADQEVGAGAGAVVVVNTEGQKNNKFDIVTQKLTALLDHLSTTHSTLIFELTNIILKALDKSTLSSGAEADGEIAKKELDSLVKLLEGLKDEIKNAKTQLKYVDSSYEEKTLLADGIIQLGTTLEDKLMQLQKANEALVHPDNTFDEAKTPLAFGTAKLGKERNDYATQLETANAALKAAQEQLKTSTDGTYDLETPLDKGIKTLGDALASANGRISELNGTIGSLKAEILRLQTANGPVNPPPDPKPKPTTAQVWKSKAWNNESARTAVEAFRVQFDKARPLNRNIKDDQWDRVGTTLEFQLPSDGGVQLTRTLTISGTGFMIPSVPNLANHFGITVKQFLKANESKHWSEKSVLNDDTMVIPVSGFVENPK